MEAVVEEGVGFSVGVGNKRADVERGDWTKLSGAKEWGQGT